MVKYYFVIKKKNHLLCGDGKSTIKELIEKNGIQDYYEELNLNEILDNGYKLEVSWKHNLSRRCKSYFRNFIPFITKANYIFSSINKATIQ